MSLPIIFIHTGYSDYLEFTLRQASHVSKDSDIYLLGNSTNNKFDFLKHINIDKYSIKSEEFRKVYKHLTSNPFEYELFCFQRWFILLEFMIDHEIDKVFVCDSDVLLYTDIDEVATTFFKSKDLVYMNGLSPGTVAASISFWTKDAIQQFCHFIYETYKNNLVEIKHYNQLVKEKNNIGGYSDMTALYHFLDKDFRGKPGNLLKVQKDTVFDLHIGCPITTVNENFKFKNLKKIFIWKNGVPYSYSFSSNKYIRFHGIHFQGANKFSIASFYNGPKFNGINKLKIKYYFKKILAFWYQKLKVRYRFAWLFDIIFKLKK